MNYRHAFHAGNFADLLKHAALTLCLETMVRRRGPMTVIDTHAGAGVYDLGSEDAARSGEGAAGIGRLSAQAEAPEAFDMLLATVARINPQDGARFYPGSPMLIASALRDGDAFVACEMRADEYARLERLLASLDGQARAMNADGFSVAAAQAPAGRDLLVIIDPPFERGDDYGRTIQTCAAVLKRNRQAQIIVWLPLKDLETFDRFLRDLEDINPPAILIVECRLRPLLDPLKMNGCALAIINAPENVVEPIREACGWMAQTLGEPGGEARVWTLEH